jgi:hypothetical protein
MVGKIDQMSREEVMAEIKRLQEEFPNLLSPDGQDAIDVTPNSVELLDAPKDTPDNRGQVMEVIEVGDKVGSRVD